MGNVRYVPGLPVGRARVRDRQRGQSLHCRSEDRSSPEVHTAQGREPGVPRGQTLAWGVVAASESGLSRRVVASNCQGQVVPFDDSGQVLIALTCLAPRVRFYHPHEFAMLLLGAAYEAPSARSPDVVLWVVESHVLVDAEIAALEDGVAFPLKVLVQVTVDSNDVHLNECFVTAWLARVVHADAPGFVLPKSDTSGPVRVQRALREVLSRFG